MSPTKTGKIRKPRTCGLAPKTCVDCSLEYMGSYNQRRCLPCRAVKASPKPRRTSNCVLCESKLKGLHPNTKFCGECSTSRRRAYWLASKLKDNNNEQARLITKYAVKVGFLPPPIEFKCTDCGRKQAECYDHRDYGKPLQVDPVCLQCNSRRGAGIAVKFPCVANVAA